MEAGGFGGCHNFKGSSTSSMMNTPRIATVKMFILLIAESKFDSGLPQA
jgi:hypothetical protein